MSLTASMWGSVSGLLAHGEKMNVIGNNISNVNTLGFKSQRMDFMDFVYQNVGTAGGTGQVGRGTSIGAIMNDFSQGAQETTTGDTDIAIMGTGFFKVKPLNNNNEYYTRAGNFTFNREGYLVNPQGYVLQGWAIDRNMANQVTDQRSNSGIVGTGAPVDVRLDTFTCPPRHTNNISWPVNLPADNAESNDKVADKANPFFSLLNTWDATQNPPIGTSQRSWQTTMQVYDEGGRAHKLTIYFDRVTQAKDAADEIDNFTNNDYWEYIITMDPSEDVRDFDPEYDPANPDDPVPFDPNVPKNLKGLLGAGTITFNSGVMTDMTCFVPQSEPGVGAANGTMWWTPNGTDPDMGDINLSKWVAAPISSNGMPMIAPNFSGKPLQANPYNYGDWDRPNSNATDHMIAIDFGLKTKNGWGLANNPDGTPFNASQVAKDANGTNGFGTVNATLQPTASTCYGNQPVEHPGAKQDGYTFGDFMGVTVSTDGVLSASYTNGQKLELYQIVLYDFVSKQNLRREGGNLYSETRESGSPNGGAPGSGVFGSTHGNSLEQSNADLSREFVNMITTQRGFQANSKNITTVDTMLETVIAMKR